jgi:hypothetical protein
MVNDFVFSLFLIRLTVAKFCIFFCIWKITQAAQSAQSAALAEATLASQVQLAFQV